MTHDPDQCLDRIEQALARIERAASDLPARPPVAASAPAPEPFVDPKHETRRVRTAAALAELDRVIGRLGAEGR